MNRGLYENLCVTKIKYIMYNGQITLFGRFYVRVDILPTCGKHLHKRTISPRRGGAWTHKATLTPPLFIEVPVPNDESERSGICVLGISILPLSTIFILDFGNVPTV